MTGMRPVQRIRAFFGTMAGQIFLILTLGMWVAAIIALLVAEQAVDQVIVHQDHQETLLRVQLLSL